MHGGHYYAGRLRRRLALRAAIAMSGCAAAVSARLADDLRRDLRLRRSRIVTIPNGVRYEPPERVTLRDELRPAAGRSARGRGRQPVSGQRAPFASKRSPFSPTGIRRFIWRSPAAAIWRTLSRNTRASAASLPAFTCSDCARISRPCWRPLTSSCCRRCRKHCRWRCSRRCSPAVRSWRAMSARSVPRWRRRRRDPGGAGDAPALAAAIDRVLSDPRAARELGNRAADRARAESRSVQDGPSVCRHLPGLLRSRSYRPLTSQPQYR